MQPASSGPSLHSRGQGHKCVRVLAGDEKTSWQSLQVRCSSHERQRWCSPRQANLAYRLVPASKQGTGEEPRAIGSFAWFGGRMPDKLGHVGKAVPTLQALLLVG